MKLSEELTAQANALLNPKCSSMKVEIKLRDCASAARFLEDKICRLAEELVNQKALRVRQIFVDNGLDHDLHSQR